MSSEEPFATGSHKTDEQVAFGQEQVDEERETSFQFSKEATNEATEQPAEAVAADATPFQDAAETNEAAAVAPAVEDESAKSSTNKNSRSSRKSRASGPSSHPDGEDGEQTARKRARKSTTTNPTASSSSTLPAAVDTDANVRLDRLRQALFRFLDLIEHRATSSSFAKALPHIDSESVEALRQQFVSQLKEAIIDESEKLIESNDLEAKLASLHHLAQEADARYHAGYEEGSEELKDVWKKDLDLETAISARAIPDQQRRVEELKKELDEVRKSNQEIHQSLLETRARSDATQRDARDSLDALESVSTIPTIAKCKVGDSDADTFFRSAFVSRQSFVHRQSKVSKHPRTCRSNFVKPWTIFCRISALECRSSCSFPPMLLYIIAENPKILVITGHRTNSLWVCKSLPVNCSSSLVAR